MSVSPFLFWTLVVLAVVFAGAFAATLSYALRQRVRMKLRPNFGKPPVPHVAIDVWDEVFRSTGLGPNRASEISFIGQAGALASINDTETWVLGALAKKARRIFEFGTATGRTTYVLARNAPDDAKVDTLTYLADGDDSYEFDANDPDAEKWRKIALGESHYDKFYYEDTPVAHKVAQHFGDSAKFDEAPYAAQIDLIFVDGAHSYSYVKSDSTKALRMVAPGGYVLWHDYSPRCPGVFKALNELGRELPLAHLKGTTLVAYRKPA
ncbi:MAG: hypothetical protein AMXMBFR74_01270 [Parvibaculum sp.]|uniref:O-methyltransferase n=1 Tax=Parvibaculum sp. TaxID=2024848 RepID=UPI0035B8B510